MEVIDNNSQQQPISIGQWFVTILLTAIPVVNIVMLIIWAFGANTNPSKANWAKASLIWILIGIGLWIVFASTIMGLIGAAALMS